MIFMPQPKKTEPKAPVEGANGASADNQIPIEDVPVINERSESSTLAIQSIVSGAIAMGFALFSAKRSRDAHIAAIRETASETGVTVVDTRGRKVG